MLSGAELRRPRHNGAAWNAPQRRHYVGNVTMEQTRTKTRLTSATASPSGSRRPQLLPGWGAAAASGWRRPARNTAGKALRPPAAAQAAAPGRSRARTRANARGRSSGAGTAGQEVRDSEDQSEQRPGPWREERILLCSTFYIKSEAVRSFKYTSCKPEKNNNKQTQQQSELNIFFFSSI